MVVDVARLAEHANFGAEELRDLLTEHSGRLSGPELILLQEIVRIADRSANRSTTAADLVTDLVGLAEKAAAGAPTEGRGKVWDGRTMNAALRRTLAARTLHELRELGLYQDANGVEPVWPHAGMLILNPVLGCSFGCAYCFRADEQHESVDWFLDGRPSKVMDEDAVVERLARHPLFIPGVTQLGLHTATTEPFLPQVRESTFRLLELLQERQWQNDVMIITKHFISAKDVARLASFTSLRILLFLTYNAAPAAMEPLGAAPGFTERRRRTIEYLAEHPSLTAAHYFRPVITGWNDSDERIADALTFGEPLGLTVIGGLKDVPHLPEISRQRGLGLPVVAADGDEEKHFPPELVDRIVSIHGRLGLTSTLVGDQSCGLTVMLSRLRGAAVPNVEALKMYDAGTARRPKCLGRCSPEQLAACAQPPVPAEEPVRELLSRTGVRAAFRIEADGVRLTSDTPPGRQEIESLAAHLRFAVFWEPSP